MSIQVVRYFGSYTRENRTEEHCFKCVSHLTNSVNFRDIDDATRFIEQHTDINHPELCDYEIVSD